MQLRLSFIAAALLIGTSLAASSAPQAEGIAIRGTDSIESSSLALEARMTKVSFEHQAASIAKEASAQIEKDLARLAKLQKQDHVSKAEATKAFANFNAHLELYGNQYHALAAKYHGSKARSLEARQNLLAPAIADLNASLKKVLPQVRLLVRHLTTNLGLNTVSTIVKQLTPGLKNIDSGLFKVLTVLGDDLGETLVDPLLRTVYGLLDGLGLNLNARDLESVQARSSTSKSSLESTLSAEVKHVSSEFEADYATFKKLLAQKKVSHKEFASAIHTLKHHAATATKKVHSLKKEAHSAGLIAARATARPGSLVVAVNQLVADLNKLLPLVDTLVHKVVGDLELNAVNQLVDALTPTLAALVTGVEALLRGLAPTLAPLVDPLLALVNALTKGLGIDLNNNTGKL
ncbi:hypothetical protein OC861_004811 [Tilletia horrida]|nr:hypothetical protein OC861_004811 [Tilletia horrida]